MYLPVLGGERVSLLVERGRGLLDLQLLVGPGVHPHGRLLVLVVPVLHDQGDDGQADAHEDDDEDAADVVDGDSAAAVVVVLADGLQRVLVPPALLQRLQLPLVQQLQDSGTTFFFEGGEGTLFFLRFVRYN